MLGVLGLLGGLGVATSSPVQAASDTAGADYWLMFPENIPGSSPNLQLFITGDAATSGTVTGARLGGPIAFDVTPGEVTTVTLPSSVQTTGSGQVQDSGIRVSAAKEVTVYGLNQREATTDAYLALPIDILGTDYLVLDTPNTIVHGSDGAEYGIVSTKDDTVVSVTPAGTYDGGTPAPFQVTLDEGETYQVQNYGSGTANLSGTEITSTAPVAVFAGNRCTNIPGDIYVSACDHNVEQLFPTSTWGTRFVSAPLATRTKGDTFRIIAKDDGTVVKLDGTQVATLDRGEVYQTIQSGGHQWDASAPVMVAQYSNSSDFDGVTSDPFMMLLPPVEQFLDHYTISTPSQLIPTNFVNVVARTASIGGIKLDGSTIGADKFTQVAGTDYSVAALPISVGTHNLTGNTTFGVGVYGYASYDSYGYPGGLALTAIAEDTDGDSLPDTWETEGVDVNNDGVIDIDLPKMGADPNVPDMFVEVDWMEKPCTRFLWFCWGGKNFAPMQAALNDVAAAFQGAPGGPINLHIDSGPNSVMNPKTNEKWGALSKANAVAHDPVIGAVSNGDYNWSEFDTIKNNNFQAARAQVFHYALYADKYQGWASTGCPSGQCSSGLARGIPSADFMVTDGPFGKGNGFTRTQERGTFMHEFGHNLALMHGGPDHSTYQGNAAFRSVMNYAYQLVGVDGTGKLDYSRGPIFADWPRIVYNGGAIGALGADDDPPLLTEDDSLTYPVALADGILARDGDGSVSFLGPETLVPGTGDQTVFFALENPSKVAATYTLAVTGLPVTQPAAVNLAAGEVKNVPVTVDTDALAPGTHTVTGMLSSSLAGPDIASTTGTVIAPDTSGADWADELRRVTEYVEQLPPGSLPSDVLNALKTQLEAAKNPGQPGNPPPPPPPPSKVATVTLDSTAPAVVNGAIPVTATFSYPVEGFVRRNLVMTNAKAENFKKVDGTTYTWDLVPLKDGKFTVQVPAGSGVSQTGDGSYASNVLERTYDGTGPTVTIAPKAGQPNPTSDPTVTFVVNAGEPVTDLAVADVMLDGTAPGGTVSVTRTSPSAFEVTVSGLLGDGTVIAELVEGAVEDAAGNGSAAVKSSAVTYDKPGNPPADLSLDIGTSNAACEQGGITLDLLLGHGDADEVTLSGVTSDESVIPQSEIVFSHSGDQHSVTLTPNSGAGRARVTITLSRGADEVSQTITVLAGDRRANTLQGTLGTDVAFARGAADMVMLAAGDDVACGGGGADRIIGGDGDDALFGQRGADRLRGSDGADRLVGGGGNNKLPDYDESEGDTLV